MGGQCSKIVEHPELRTKVLIKDKDTNKKLLPGEFPGGPVIRNPRFLAKGPGSIPGQGNKIPYAPPPKKLV